VNRLFSYNQDKLLGDTIINRLTRRSRKISKIYHTTNNIYWKDYGFGNGERSINMLNLRYVEYDSTFFYIKPFNKD
jgi:hypothetical protein